MKKIEIFTDGACRGNPGPGGFGAIVRYKDKEKHINGAEKHTTNNRMEMMAVISALEFLKESCEVDITTDSKYVHNGIVDWLPGWKKRNWLTADKKPVKNQELWQRLEEAVSRHKVRWHWIKGHSGHKENELADELARSAIDKLMEIK